MISTRYVLTVFVLLLAAACSQRPEPQTGRPNILLIVADDLGYTDVGSYGGNIRTPVLDGLAREGHLFSNFHVLPTCSPTRSALLTGNDNHVAGLGIMEELNYPALDRLHLPGYSGHLSNQVATLPELLRENGYHTYMVGKWHLGEGPGMIPNDRGFEESFVLGTGGGSHWNDKRALAPPQHMTYYRNDREVELPDDFYSTRNYTDSLLGFLRSHADDNKPFFAFLSYTAVHDPLHAPQEYIDKYKGAFDMGWDSLRVMRTRNLQALGLVPKNAKLFTSPAFPRWTSLNAEQKAEFARDMEVYAAMLDYMDENIGRVIHYLRETGAYDNTLIIFMSDNGANGAVATSYPGNADGRYLGEFNNAHENRGLKGSYIEMGPGWAQAASGPYRFFKTFTTEGGIRAPLILKMPGVNSGGTWNKEFVHVTDLMPTVLEMTGTAYPSAYKGNTIHPLIGNSLLPMLKGASVEQAAKGMGYELFEMKAYIRGNWKILRLPVPLASGDWQLYDLSKDPGETTDLSAEFPEIRQELIALWENYAQANALHDHRGHYDTVYLKAYGVK